MVCTIHQPRSDIFKLFDLVLLLSEGCTMYCGPGAGMVEYFAARGYACSTTTNPCDHALALATIDRRTAEEEQATAQRARTLIADFANTCSAPQSYQSSDKPLQKFEPVASRSQQPSSFGQFAVLTERFAKNTLKGKGPIVSEITQVCQT